MSKALDPRPNYYWMTNKMQYGKVGLLDRITNYAKPMLFTCVCRFFRDWQEEGKAYDRQLKYLVRYFSCWTTIISNISVLNLMRMIVDIKIKKTIIIVKGY